MIDREKSEEVYAAAIAEMDTIITGLQYLLAHKGLADDPEVDRLMRYYTEQLPSVEEVGHDQFLEMLNGLFAKLNTCAVRLGISDDEMTWDNLKGYKKMLSAEVDQFFENPPSSKEPKKKLSH